MEPAIDDLLAKQAITEVIYRYCRGLDRMDRAMVEGVWHPDGTADYGSLFRGSAAEWIEWVWRRHEQLYRHSHQMTNVLIEVDGDRAVSETYAIITLRSRGEHGRFVDRIGHNRYLDRWSRRAGVWAIDHRRMVSDFRRVVECDETELTVGEADSLRNTRDPSYEFFRSGGG